MKGWIPRSVNELIDKLDTNKNNKSYSLETRKKMSVAQKGRIFSEEHRAKLSVLKKGKPWSEARRAIQEYKKI